MKKLFALFVCLAFLGVASAKDDDAKKILEFDTMVGVQGPFLGATNPIRGIGGGGAAWTLKSGRGEIDTAGRLEIHVRGLVLVRTGTNPVNTFRGVVSCQSIDGTGKPSIVNVSTVDFPATATGDSDIEATVSLPQPCIAPIVFVTLSAGRWIAVTGAQSTTAPESEDR